MTNFEWIPLKQVGFFKFGDDVEVCIDKLTKVNEEKNEKVGWEVYTIDDLDIRIYAENGKMVSIACYGNFYYKGMNMIGCTIDDVNDLLEITPMDDIDEIEIDDEIQRIYEYYPVDLQIWTKDGEVVTIFAGSG